MVKRLRHSIFILVFLQGGQNLASLLLLPVLARSLGPEGYGQVAYCVAFIGYFILLADWGFGLGASQKIAINRGDRLKCSQIFWTTFFAKCFFSVIGACILFLLIELIPSLGAYSLLLWLVYLTVIATVIAPAFYYQGTESLELMFFIGLVVRFASIPIIYIFVRGPNDVAWAIGIQAGAQLIAAVINFVRLMRSGEVTWTPPQILQIVDAIKESWTLFLSSASGGIFASSLVVVLGWVSDITTVGYFVGGLNLIKAAQGLLAPISQVVFPRLSHLFVHAKNEAILALRKVFIFQSVLTLLMGITLFLLAPFLLPLLMGENFSDSIKVFQIMTPLIFLGGLSNLLGQQILVTLGYHRAYAVIGFCIGSIGIMLLGILGYFFYADGAAVSLVFSEILVILTMLWYLMRVEPQFFEQFKRVA